MTDFKRILITLRCDDCGRDLEHADHVFVNTANAKVSCCCDGCALEAHGLGLDEDGFIIDVPEVFGWSKN